jgi:short-subunit dehydrogenase
VRFSELDTAAASALFEVDVIGAMRMCHAVRPIMLQAGGNDEQPAAGALLAL